MRVLILLADAFFRQLKIDGQDVQEALPRFFGQQPAGCRFAMMLVIQSLMAALPFFCQQAISPT